MESHLCQPHVQQDSCWSPWHEVCQPQFSSDELFILIEHTDHDPGNAGSADDADAETEWAAAVAAAGDASSTVDQQTVGAADPPATGVSAAVLEAAAANQQTGCDSPAIFLRLSIHVTLCSAQLEPSHKRPDVDVLGRAICTRQNLTHFAASQQRASDLFPVC